MSLDDHPDGLPAGPSLDGADGWFEVPDAMDFVLEAAAMLSVFAAYQFEHVDAMRRELLAEASGRGIGVREVIERGIRLELAAALRVTERAAGELITRAEALVHRFPRMLDALSCGRTTERHAEILVDAMMSVEPEFHDRIVEAAIELAEVESVGTFRRSLRKLIEAERTQTLLERHEVALDQRRVRVEFGDDAMAWLMVYLPAVEACAIQARATAMAKVIAAREGETRTLDQIRADVIADLLIEGEATAQSADVRGIRATVAVTVPALALLDDAVPGAEPATVEGMGPIPIARARELCGGADGWMRVLTHPETGMVLSVGRDQYRPLPGLRRLVKWRADRCMAPGCGMPASRCEIDHTIAWELGGTTSLLNLAPICKGHHIVKHHGGWTVRQVDGSGGALEWTSPSGRRYRVEPERRVPVFRPAAARDAPF
jgi:hypothetical protein